LRDETGTRELFSPTSIAQGRESEWNIRLPARNVVLRKPPPPTTFSQKNPINI
jgi:hypothetical protein